MLPERAEHAAVRPARAQIGAYAFDGRIAVRQDQARHYAHITWRHTADADDILLTSPLGQGVAELTRDTRGARLMTADKQVVEAPNWEDLSARVFGFALPLARMPRWLLGDITSSARDAHGRPQAAVADGWAIRYLDYESQGIGALPVLIEFQRDDIEVRLKVDSWQLD